MGGHPPWHGGGAGCFPVCQRRATKEHKDESASAEGESGRDFCEVPSSFVKALCRLEFKPFFWAGSTPCPLCADWKREFKTSYLPFLFGCSLRFIFLGWGRRNGHIEFPCWNLAWDSCVLTRMIIQVSYFAIFFEDSRKREPVEKAFSGFCSCFCTSCILTVPHHTLTLFCSLVSAGHSKRLWLQFLRVSAVSVTPSRWCHQLAHLHEHFLVGGVLSLLQSLHMS